MADGTNHPTDLVITYTVDAAGRYSDGHQRLTDALQQGYRVLEVFQATAEGAAVVFLTVVLTRNSGGLDIPYLGHKRTG